MRLSIPDFLQKARVHQAKLKETLSTIRHTDQILHKWDSIWSDQCDYIAASLHNIGQSTHDFAVFLSPASHLPISVISTRYQIVTELDCFEINMQKLLSFLAPFRSNSHAQSCLHARHRQKILQHIEEIIQGGEEINDQIE